MRRFVLILLSCILIAGCKHTEYIEVPVPEYHERQVNIVDSVHDTDTVHDNHIQTLQEVDSSYLASVGIINPPKSAWLLKETHDRQEKSSKNHVNNSSANEIDTIRVPYPVERQLTAWERTKVDYGGYAIIILATILLIILVYIFIKLRKWARGSLSK